MTLFLLIACAGGADSNKTGAGDSATEQPGDSSGGGGDSSGSGDSDPTGGDSDSQGGTTPTGLGVLTLRNFQTDAPLANADVSLDGASIGVLNSDGLLAFDMSDPGPHTLEATLTGYPTWRLDFQYESGDFTFVTSHFAETTLVELGALVGVTWDGTTDIVRVFVYGDAGMSTGLEATVDIDLDYTVAVVQDTESSTGMSVGNTIPDGQSVVVFAGVSPGTGTVTIDTPNGETCTSAFSGDTLDTTVVTTGGVVANLVFICE